MKAWRKHNQKISASETLSPEQKKSQRITKKEARNYFKNQSPICSPLLARLFRRIGIKLEVYEGI